MRAGLTPLLTIKEAAETLGVGEQSVRRYIRDGELRAARLSDRIIRIQPHHLEEFRERGKKQAEPETPKQNGEPRVYFIRSGEFVKIGFSRNIQYRMKHLQIGNPIALELLFQMLGTEGDENYLHMVLSGQNHRHEWFRLTERIKQLIEDLMDGAPLREAIK